MGLKNREEINLIELFDAEVLAAIEQAIAIVGGDGGA